MFSKTSVVSPFANPADILSSVVLLVCKVWLRVATPLLYHTVVIRSKAQARSLVAAVRGNHNPGRFIGELRVEGFGAHMSHILNSALNITDLFLSTEIHSPDTGSCPVLA
jgi:hypothetical protein